MIECARIGLQIVPSDQFWVLVREAVYAYARELSIELVPINDERLLSAPYAEQVRMIEQLRGLGLRALICAQLAERVVEQFLAQGVAVVSLGELELRHPQLSSTQPRAFSM